MKKFDVYVGKEKKQTIYAYDLIEARRIYTDQHDISIIEDTEYTEGDKPEEGGEPKYVSN